LNRSSVLERNLSGCKPDTFKQRIGAIIMENRNKQTNKTYNLAKEIQQKR
jgi:hypothetical protein